MGLVSINILKDQDEKNSLAKNQSVSENKHQGPVPEMSISVNPRLKFCSVFVFYIPIHCSG